MSKLVISLLAIFISLFYSIDLCTAQSKASISATVTLMDKSTLEVQNLTLVYHWYFKDEWESYINPIKYKTELDNFICNEIISGAKIERNIPLKDLLRIEIIWKTRKGNKSKEYQEDDEVINKEYLIITLKDNTTVKLAPPIVSIAPSVLLKSTAPDLVFPSTLLQNKKSSEIEKASFVTFIEVKGEAIIHGKKGEFSAILYDYEKPKDEPSQPLITKIVFFE